MYFGWKSLRLGSEVRGVSTATLMCSCCTGNCCIDWFVLTTTMKFVTHKVLRLFTFSIIKVTGIPHVTCVHTQTNKHACPLCNRVSGKTMLHFTDKATYISVNNIQGFVSGLQMWPLPNKVMNSCTLFQSTNFIRHQTHSRKHHLYTRDALNKSGQCSSCLKFIEVCRAASCPSVTEISQLMLSG